jgi:RNA polymerase sigma-70 factor (ECF subfamily)
VVRARSGRGPTGGDELVAAAQQGDPAAVRALFAELHPRLLRFFGAQEPRAVDDLTAEVWEGVARGLDDFEGGIDDLRAWVFSIARRRLADHRRRAVRKPSVPVETSSFAELPGVDLPDRDAIARLSGSEAGAWIRTLLSPDQAEVVLLRVVADLDARTVASVMGRTENWVRVTQHRALRRLADRLGERSDVTR